MERYLKPLLLLLAANNLVHCQVNDRIVGGANADIKNYPWLVSIWYDSAPACGGSLISPQYVLSAAHCFPPEHDVAGYTIIAGTTSLRGATESGTQSGVIDTITLNPSYSQDAYSADVAVIKIKQAFAITDYVQTIKLPSASVAIPAGMPCTIAGWGYVRQSDPLPSPMTLQTGYVTVISDRTCNCLYHINNSGGSITSITQDMICAGSAQGTVDACQGDSGGPLTCSMNGVSSQVGLVSWGDACGAKDRPGVYIEVSYYVSWIQSIAPDVVAEDFTVDMTPVADDENGCVGSDGQVYPYPNKASAVLVTFMSLPLYWLTAYLLSNL